MASNANLLPTVAFFGATDGCAGTALALALKAGHRCTALSRSESKLRNLLLTQHSLTPSTIDSNLRIIQGDIKDPLAVSQTLLISDEEEEEEEEVVDIIISGVGSIPEFQFNLLHPVTLLDPQICQDGMNTILKCLANIQTGRDQYSTTSRSTSTQIEEKSRKSLMKMKKPMIITISTTGLSSAKTRDLPILMIPLYHWFLKIPHDDKLAMEELLITEARKRDSGEEEETTISGAVVVRPSLLTDGESMGREKVRVGWERMAFREDDGRRDDDEKMEKEKEKGRPAVGYTIPRANVGKWIFEEIIRCSEQGGEGGGGRERWVGKAVTLTS